MIRLVDVGIRETDDDRTKPFCFEIFPLIGDKIKSSKSVPNEAGKMSEGRRNRFRFSTNDEDHRWISFKVIIPFYD